MNAIEKAKHFLSNLNHIDLDEIDGCDFSKPHLPYYIYMDSDRCGCFESQSQFISKKDLNNFIAENFGSSEWDNVVILDVEQNKIVIPHI